MTPENRELMCADIRVSGHVQGVGFRYWATQEAQPRGITGEARNLDDGSVRILAEGEEWAVEELIGVLRTQRAPGRVDELDVARRPLSERGATQFFSA